MPPRPDRAARGGVIPAPVRCAHGPLEPRPPRASRCSRRTCSAPCSRGIGEGPDYWHTVESWLYEHLGDCHGPEDRPGRLVRVGQPGRRDDPQLHGRRPARPGCGADGGVDRSRADSRRPPRRGGGSSLAPGRRGASPVAERCTRHGPLRRRGAVGDVSVEHVVSHVTASRLPAVGAGAVHSRAGAGRGRGHRPGSGTRPGRRWPAHGGLRDAPGLPRRDERRRLGAAPARLGRARRGGRRRPGARRERRARLEPAGGDPAAALGPPEADGLDPLPRRLRRHDRRDPAPPRIAEASARLRRRPARPGSRGRVNWRDLWTRWPSATA